MVAAALMPDGHLGYAAPIGAVLKTKDFIVPAWVGFDIGCGMIAVKLQGKNLDGKIKEKWAYSCCMNYDFDSPGCNRIVVNREKPNILSFTNH